MQSLSQAINLIVGFLGGLLGGLLLMLLGHPIASIFQSKNPLVTSTTASDVLATANTYIVFTTFIFVLITIIFTGLGLYFSKWFSITKEKEIRENMRDLFDALDKDSKIADSLVKELLKCKDIYDSLHKLVQSRVQEEIMSRDSELGERVDFSDDLTEEQPK